MSQADVERFVADLKNDRELLKEVQTGSTGLASVVSLAKAKGYEISIDEAKAYIEQQARKELSDEQLDVVAGGKGGHHHGGGGSYYIQTNVVVLGEVAATASVTVATTVVEAVAAVTTAAAAAEIVVVLA